MFPGVPPIHNILFNNSFSGPIPLGFSTCSSLVRVRVQNNLISGTIPTGFGNLPKLQRLELANNNLTGTILDDFSLSLSLSFIDVSWNRLESSLPSNILFIPSLQNFIASNNNLRGNIPDQFQDYPSLSVLDLSSNHFSGKIPQSIASCERLVNLNLGNNQFTAEIPRPIAALPMFAILDLSNNSLIGTIPENFGSSPALEMLNLSYNKPEGPVPNNGILTTINPNDLIGNVGLCGGNGILPPCSQSFSTTASRQRKRKIHIINHIIVGFAVGISVILSLGLIVFVGKKLYKRWYLYNTFFTNWYKWSSAEWPWRLIAFQRLSFTSANILACVESNVIGMGSTGIVYKAEIQCPQSIVAVKKLWRSDVDVESGDDLFKEVNLLRRLRHRNIVRRLGYLHNENDVIMVYEYMPNGNLGEALHGENATKMLVDWVSRYNIAVGVANGLAYLHHDCNPSVIHRDVKSNNILLDADFEAKITDFGLARTMIQKNETVSMVAGSYGYIAPAALKRNPRKNTKLVAICCFTLASKMRNRDFSVPNFLPIRGFTYRDISQSILSVQGDIKFAQFKQSIIPASAVLSASFEVFPTPILQRAEAILRCQYIDKDALLLYMEAMGIEVQQDMEGLKEAIKLDEAKKIEEEEASKIREVKRMEEIKELREQGKKFTEDMKIVEAKKKEETKKKEEAKKEKKEEDKNMGKRVEYAKKIVEDRKTDKAKGVKEDTGMARRFIEDLLIKEAHKMVKAAKIEEERKIEEAKKEEEAKKIEEARKREDAKKIEEAIKKRDDARKIEEAKLKRAGVTILSQGRKMEEAKKSEEEAGVGGTKMEEAKKSEEAIKKSDEARKIEEAIVGGIKFEEGQKMEEAQKNEEAKDIKDKRKKVLRGIKIEEGKKTEEMKKVEEAKDFKNKGKGKVDEGPDSEELELRKSRKAVKWHRKRNKGISKFVMNFELKWPVAELEGDMNFPEPIPLPIPMPILEGSRNRRGRRAITRQPTSATAAAACQPMAVVAAAPQPTAVGASTPGAGQPKCCYVL
ncbi:unnamed protein product [Camellia sinensis]